MKHNRWKQSWESLLGFVLNHPWRIISLSLLLAGTAGWGMARLELKNDYRVFFSKDNPQRLDYESFQKIYTKEDNILMVLTHPDREVFSPTFAEAIQWLTAEAWKLPFATRVDSVTNFQHSEAEKDDLMVGDLIPEGEAESLPLLAKAKNIAHAEPMLKHRVLGDSERVTAVNVVFTLPGKEGMEVVETATAARELKEHFLKRFPEFKVHLTGMVMLNNAFAETSVKDMATLTPLMYGAMFLLMSFFLRSWLGMLGGFMVVFVSTVTAMGLMGWMGIPITPPSAIAPTIIMTLAIADSIHILMAYGRNLGAGANRRAAMKAAMQANARPVFLTSVTTALGFLSLNFSDAPPFRDLGNVVAMGVVAAWFFSMTLLPALMVRLPYKGFVRKSETITWSHRWADFIIRHRRWSLGGSVAAVMVLTAFIPRIELNDQWVEYFDHSIEFRGDTEYAMDHVSGIYTLEYSFESGESGGVSEHVYLQELEDFAEWMKGQPGVLQVQSLADVMKRLNRNMHGDDPDWYRLPEQRNLAAQYLLLFEMSLPYGLDLNNQVNVDKSSSRLTVTLGNLSTREVRGLIARADERLQEHLPESMHAVVTSPSVMFSYISQRNIESMLMGTFLAVLLISLILGIALKSARYGWISLIPNLIPAILGFGAWGLLVGSVGMSLAVVTGMTLGIVVDDTVHFLEKYLRMRREQNASPADAIRRTFETVGPAITATTIILVTGFLILGFSAFRLNNWMAQLTAFVITFALLADFILLPALLLTLDQSKKDATTAIDIKENETEEKPVFA